MKEKEDNYDNKLPLLPKVESPDEPKRNEISEHLINKLFPESPDVPKYQVCYSDTSSYHIKINGKALDSIEDQNWIIVQLLDNELFKKELAELRAELDAEKTLNCDLSDRLRECEQISVNRQADLERLREENERLKANLNRAFVAGRSKTTWEQFQKDLIENKH